VKQRLLFPIWIAILLISSLGSTSSKAQSPIVRALLFYSPTCTHCHVVIDEVLPPLMKQFAGQFEVFGIDVTQESGQAFYQSAIKQYRIPDERLGVPTMIVGETVLVGSAEIPQQLPGLIETGLLAGGVAWPTIPGLDETIREYENQVKPETTQTSGGTLVSRFRSNFLRDQTANTLSVMVLVAMVAVLIAVVIRFVQGRPESHSPARWLLPALALAGLGVAIYLSIVEVTENEALCGPVGNCNAVQQSPYARLFGVLPVGVLGMLGYVGILLAYLVSVAGPQSLRRAAVLAVWGMALFGVLFSIYLTFLDPFVIGATCAWCLTSAVLITAILWINTGAAVQAWDSPESTMPEGNLA